jgi:pescadillo
LYSRLCILKGIFPRDPKKKKFGKDKTYYHKKDIAFLAHEPLLHKFRTLKTHLRKLKKAKAKKQTFRVEVLQKSKPQMTLDHLVRERYPSFIDAIRDLDDPLTMAHLFAQLPVKTTRNHTEYHTSTCLRVCREFQQYVVHSFALRKVFVSIKGFYYQADIQGQPVTWLVPHNFKQKTPKNVDYRVMLTFLDFYLTLLRFTLCKLYHDQGLRYPPRLDRVQESAGEFLNAITIETIADAKQADDKVAAAAARAASAASTSKLPSAAQVSAQAKVDQIVKSIATDGTNGTESSQDDDDSSDGDSDGDATKQAPQSSSSSSSSSTATASAAVDEDDAMQLDDFTALQQGDALVRATEVHKQNDEHVKVKTLFAGMIILLAREVPQDSLEFVCRCAGAKVMRQSQLSDEDIKSIPFTHHIVDRVKPKPFIPNRHYVQPQWVYDSFNTRALLPFEPYVPGASLPPHLSPFVDDYKEGYVPKQREILKRWGSAANQDVELDDATDEKVATAQVDENDVDIEEQYAAELAKESSGIAYSRAQAADSSDVEEEAGSDSNDEDSEDDEDSEAGSDDSDSDIDDETPATPATKSTKSTRKRKSPAAEQDEIKELAKTMMNRKSARLYGRMQHGIQKKAAANAALLSKRRKIEKRQQPEQSDDVALRRSSRRSKASTKSGGRRK